MGVSEGVFLVCVFPLASFLQAFLPVYFFLPAHMRLGSTARVLFSLQQHEERTSISKKFSGIP